MLWGFWYPALRSEQVRRHKLVRAMLLDVPLVLGRDAAGKPFALRDVCPHRAFPLSFGQFDGQDRGVRVSRLAIRRAHRPVPHDSFAHRRFQAEMRPDLCGQLSVRGARRLRVGVHDEPRRARSRASMPPAPPELPNFSDDVRIAHLSADLPCGVDQAIIGLMDPAHGPFVHQSWWWRTRRSIRNKAENVSSRFRMDFA